MCIALSLVDRKMGSQAATSQRLREPEYHGTWTVI